MTIERSAVSGLARRLVTAATAVAVLAACEITPVPNDSTGAAGTRSFYMGYTTWPFAIGPRSSGPSAQEFIYSKIQEGFYADIAPLHFMDGIPWKAGTDDYYYPAALDFGRRLRGVRHRCRGSRCEGLPE